VFGPVIDALVPLRTKLTPVYAARLAQLENQMFAFHQKTPEFLAEFFLVELADVFELHDRLRATASATLMPSTPAESMPPA